ncbi:hypothetical protein [Siphonobacter aquaeclarae]|uniref:Outer membrane lipoprotein-sorting protein n=1 Tax=Siphonobacter aquaeclarae TaxID=563176 RepID=A0A1G9IVU7_9BACT|nr:hypothetical protein [Siphonobacter aquaeclarae]SDL29196.1 hypothetical protein SAMN04488090_0640 [Siphonobacter aquaeclarae]
MRLKPATFFLLLLAAPAFSQTADEILDKHIAALGGAGKLAAVKTVYFERTAKVKLLKIPASVTVRVGKASFTEFSLLGIKTTITVTPEESWEVIGSNPPKKVKEKEHKQLVAGLNPFGPLYGARLQGEKVELIGKETLDKTDVFHLKVTDKDNEATDVFVDAGTYLIKAIKNDYIESELSDYRQIEGIPFAFETENEKPKGKATVHVVKLNPDVQDTLFMRP